jgi:hypothetical protein
MITSRQAEPTVEGRTHASSVMPVDNRSDGASGTRTRAFEPLNDSAFPKRPDAVRVAFTSVPGLPVPEESVALEPAASSNP